MKTIPLVAVAVISLLSQSAFADPATVCPTDGYGPSQYLVHIDPSNGDAFIRTPCGWRYVRTIEPERIAEAIRITRVQSIDRERERQDVATGGVK